MKEMNFMPGKMQALFSNFESKSSTICCKNLGNKAVRFILKTVN